jgi:hypothetical protein
MRQIRMIKTYSEMSKLETFIERFEYLKLKGKVGDETFGYSRYLNQRFYHTPEWRDARDKVIIRDNGCDLGIFDRAIIGKILIHHINPITEEDILERNPIIFDLENLICVSKETHDAIHFGDSNLLIADKPIIRTKNDTCPWRC